MRKELHLSCQRRKTLVEVAGSRDGSRWSKVSSQIEGIVTNREKWKQNREERKLKSVYLRWLLVVTTFSGDTKTIATPIDCGDNCGGNLSCLFFLPSAAILVADIGVTVIGLCEMEPQLLD